MTKREEILQVLSSVTDPWMNTDYVSARMAKISDDAQAVTIQLGYPAKTVQKDIELKLQDAFQKAAIQVQVTVEQKIIAHAVQRTLKVLPNVKNIIAVSSGKGGVGKSTVAANLALALSAEGARVGVLDADIYGPSQPMMLGALGRPMTNDGQNMNPIETLGLEVNSIGFLIDPDEPMIWRGPLVAQALTQLLTQTNWHDLDYLVIDMPPGTGDIQLTLAQNIPVTGAVVVTTPQDIALIDAKKGIVMFEKVEVPVLGIVENMSVHICSNCGHHEPIFGTGGAEKLAEKYHTQLLGQMPLHISLREDLDKGTPTVISRPESEFTAIYRQLADRVAAQLYWQGEVIPGEISFRAV